MKRKSISGFVTGLLGLIAGVPIGFYAFYIFLLIFGLSKAGTIYEISIWLIPLAGILALVALMFYFKKANVGGYIMFAAFISYIIPFILSFTVKGLSIIDIILPFILGVFPAIMLLISAILGIKSKK